MADKILIPLSQYAANLFPSLLPLTHITHGPEEEIKEGIEEAEKKYEEEQKTKKREKWESNKPKHTKNIPDPDLQEQPATIKPKRTKEEIKEENAKVAEQTEFDWMSAGRHKMNLRNEAARKYKEENPVKIAINSAISNQIIPAGANIDKYINKLDLKELTRLKLLSTAIGKNLVLKAPESVSVINPITGEKSYLLGGSAWTDEQIKQAERYEENAPQLRAGCRRWTRFEDGVMYPEIICDDGEIYTESQ